MAKKVLIIDDDRSTVRFLSVLLKESGYEPHHACDGSEGLAKVEEVNPDLIILDVMMPKKSGFVVFKQLKKRDEYSSIPVLMLTGVAGILEENNGREGEDIDKPFDSLRDALRKTIRHMREEGLIRPDMFLDKPVDPESFLARVRELIDK